MSHTAEETFHKSLELEPLQLLVVCSALLLLFAALASWMESGGKGGGRSEGSFPPRLFFTKLCPLGNCTQCHHSARPNVAFIGPLVFP